jgi:hypothetical protein
LQRRQHGADLDEGDRSQHAQGRRVPRDPVQRQQDRAVSQQRRPCQPLDEGDGGGARQRQLGATASQQQRSAQPGRQRAVQRGEPVLLAERRQACGQQRQRDRQIDLQRMAGAEAAVARRRL